MSRPAADQYSQNDRATQPTAVAAGRVQLAGALIGLLVLDRLRARLDQRRTARRPAQHNARDLQNG